MWPSHGLFSPCFTDPKMESSRVGIIYHISNSRSVVYWKTRARVELERCNIRKLFILVLFVVSSSYLIFVFGARIFYFWSSQRDLFEKTRIDAKTLT